VSYSGFLLRRTHGATITEEQIRRVSYVPTNSHSRDASMGNICDFQSDALPAIVVVGSFHNASSKRRTWFHINSHSCAANPKVMMLDQIALSALHPGDPVNRKVPALPQHLGWIVGQHDDRR